MNLGKNITTLLQKGPVSFKINNPISPITHLAFEKYLFERCTYPVCFIRTNTNSVVIGRNQFYKAECNLENMKRDNIELIRRSTGGGAVYLDDGNCMIGIMGYIPMELSHEIIVKGINKTFGVESHFTGKNDIKVDEMKVAGFAYNKKGDKLLSHACILVDSDVTKHSLYLTPHQKKIYSKDIKSVSQNVINLNVYSPGKRRYDLEFALESEFKKHFKTSRPYNLDVGIEDIPEVKAEIDKLRDPSYLYKDIGKYNMVIEKKFTFGFLQLYLNISRSDITDYSINTDSVDLNIKTYISNVIAFFNDNKCDSLSGDIEKEIYEWIKNELK